MNQPNGTPTTAPAASPEKKALLEAFDTVLKTQADEREAEHAASEARRRRRVASRLLMVVCSTLIIFTSVYLYVERPEWVFPRPPAPESVALREASLRVGVANVVQHIERFKRQTGELPVTLEQAGANSVGIRYERTATGYRLHGDGDGVRVTFDSGEPLARLIGNSFEVISRRGR